MLLFDLYQKYSFLEKKFVLSLKTSYSDRGRVVTKERNIKIFVKSQSLFDVHR